MCHPSFFPYPETWRYNSHSYYVCNREPTEVLIDTLWSLDFFAFRDAMNLSASLREPSHLSMR